MTRLDPRSRRALGRTLTKLASASVAESLDHGARQPTSDRDTTRIGFTGAPGAGKSTLVSRLAKRRLAACRDQGGIAILGIDPTSPLSGGSILGDRIRMDNIVNEPELYIRSLSSRSANDGLADNVADLLDALDSHGFCEVLLETVGVGQAEHAVRHAVDSLVMVLQPNAGDAVQAMKAGILELADIYVINKADLVGARKTASEVRGIVQRHRDTRTWLPPVIEVTQDGEAGLAELDDAISQHLDWLSKRRDPTETRRLRRRYHVQSLIVRRVAELLGEQPQLLDEPTLRDTYRKALQTLAGDEAATDPEARRDTW
ncbi:GTPase [Litchfieldella qijiaojingensis]|uniref:GTPase n=1 Tax=Litchfieldella qijiaojingensis TaxID=980347 RepID=A0ABQ2YTJ0_9GAMM|nr:hypothetical protein [Halomonas qijiaojingensis]GGX94915.1 GTPase [Halomonas qijiaojingensis]